MRIRTPDFRPYRLSRPALEPVQPITPNFSGWRGIRTPEPLSRPPAFQTGAIVHSAIHPWRRVWDSNPRDPFGPVAFKATAIVHSANPPDIHNISRRLTAPPHRVWTVPLILVLHSVIGRVTRCERLRLDNCPETLAHDEGDKLLHVL